MQSQTHSDRRLLVVDDERVQRKIVACSVESLGFIVDVAGSVDEAISALTAHSYDTVVLDLGLGGREGLSLLHNLTVNAGDPVVLFLTGMDDRIRAASLRLAGALGLRVAGAVRKPITPSALRALLQRAPQPARHDDPIAVPCPTEDELCQAIERGEIVAEYQPKVSLESHRVVGVEALARWHRDGAAAVPPDLFIPLAEQTGLIMPLTAAILRQSLGSCRRWRSDYPNCGVAVNISPLVLANPALPEEIEAMLRAADLAPDALIAEITESVVISDPLLAVEVLTSLRIKGIGLSIDDFGTGHSSLLSLMRLPFSELKIDRSFVAVCLTDSEAWKIVRATVALAHELGMQVVAEGVETAAIEQRIREAGCDIAQGWRFACSMTETALHAWLAHHALTLA